jgi:bifunctional UDP-N-acetylglucosamine pyrophosphorylase/glucosamine-1-phosphate N-acetyltransferase
MTDAPQQDPANRERSCLAIILAAGEGTRMRSAIPKVLHRVAGRTMLAHVLHAVRAAGADRIAVVIGPERDDVAAEVHSVVPDAEVFVQSERLGTAHAVLVARPAIERGADDVVVAFADTPLVTAETFRALRAPLSQDSALVVLGFEAKNPTGYGRLIQSTGKLVAIREERDASAEERQVRLCNAGLMAIAGDRALSLLTGIGNENAKGEYYLTDAVELAAAGGRTVAVVLAPEAEVQGVNDRVQLATAEADLQTRLRLAAMAGGATLVAPQTVFLQPDTKLRRDVVVDPNVVFGPDVEVEEGAHIRSFSHIEGARIGRGSIIGPFARLRPGANLGEGVHIGNFVEVKNAELGPGVKANHLAYLGDASVGEGTNVGAGTITCNYDGARKHRTEIGPNAFIGTNTSLVAPVTVGAGAYIGSGSVITENVPAEALALGRGRQVVKENWAKTQRPSKG